MYYIDKKNGNDALDGSTSVIAWKTKSKTQAYGLKIVILILCVFFIASGVCLSAPFLVCDPQSGVTHYEITFGNQTPFDVVAQADGSLKYDLAAVLVGDHSLSIKAVKVSEEWGRIPSDPSPFSFRRPAAPEKPSGVFLIK